MVIAPSIADAMPYDVERDFTAIVLVVTVPEAVVVIPKLGLTSLPTFVAYAKAHPNQLNMASDRQRWHAPSGRRAAEARGRFPGRPRALSRRRAGGR